MKINLNKSLNIRIDGEVAKEHSLPLDFFINVGQSLQELVKTVAKNSLLDEDFIDLNNFSIEICGFKEGSAIPQFRFTPITPTLGDVLSQRKIVNKSLDKILQISHQGNYMELKKEYRNPEVRNEMVEKIYNYVHSFGNAPVEIVDFDKKGNRKTLYTIHKFKTETKKSLISKIKEKNDETIIKEAVGTVSIRRKKGKIRKKVIEYYEDQDKSLSFSTNEIKHGNKKYILAYTLRCLFEKEDDYFVIQSEMLDIIGTGKTEEETIANFSEEFDFIYNKYKNLNENNATKRILRIKAALENLVESVKTK